MGKRKFAHTHDRLHEWLDNGGLTIAQGMQRLDVSSFTFVQTCHHLARQAQRKLIVNGDHFAFGAHNPYRQPYETPAPRTLTAQKRPSDVVEDREAWAEILEERKRQRGEY